MAVFVDDFKSRQGNSYGFTIVEVIIVLAIAGLILMMVFEAIPALERSSRNNQRRQDIQTVLSLISHYELNNSGTIPSTANLQSLINNYDKNQFSYYTSSEMTVSDPGMLSQVVSIANNTDLDHVVISNHAKCGTTGGSASNAGAGYNDVVALYTIETGGGTAHQCEQL